MSPIRPAQSSLLHQFELHPKLVGNFLTNLMKKFGALALAVMAFSACTDDDLIGPGFICDVTNPVVDLFITPSSGVVLVHSPARASDVGRVEATATNRAGSVRTDVPIKFSSSDTTIATVDSTGVVRARKPGTVRITASTCGKKAVSEITVSLVAIAVQIRLDTGVVVAGDSIIVRARAVAQDSTTVSGAKFVFSSSPAAGLTIVQKTDTSAVIRTSTPGTFTITATGEGASASAQLIVAPRVFIGATALTGNQGGLDVGRDFGCGLISLGRLYCWGANEFGQLGAATDSICFEEGTTGAGTKPCSLNPRRAGPTRAFASATAGDGFACALTPAGEAYCWGSGAFGKLGRGNGGGAGVPELVTAALRFTSISAGGNHACAIAVGGGAYCWGQDTVGQLGDARRVNSTTPIPVADGNGGAAQFSAITSGLLHTCGLQNGAAYCWGRTQDGEIGSGANTVFDTPVLVPGGLGFGAISAGGDTVLAPVKGPGVILFRSHTCGIAAGGAAYCWGSNHFGQLGSGTVGGASAVPVPVSGGLAFTRISAGGHHTCGLTTTSEVYCWGRNSDLQLGRGPASGGGGDSSVPVKVQGGALPGGVTFTSISAGMHHSCAVGTDGAAYCWGSNIFGALGNSLQAAFRGFPQRVATPQ